MPGEHDLQFGTLTHGLTQVAHECMLYLGMGVEVGVQLLCIWAVQQAATKRPFCSRVRREARRSLRSSNWRTWLSTALAAGSRPR
jgi:hypothetical protein